MIWKKNIENKLEELDALKIFASRAAGVNDIKVLLDDFKKKKEDKLEGKNNNN